MEMECGEIKGNQVNSWIAQFVYGGKSGLLVLVSISQLMDKLWVDCWYDTIEVECGEIQGN